MGAWARVSVDVHVFVRAGVRARACMCMRGCACACACACSANSSARLATRGVCRGERRRRSGGTGARWRCRRGPSAGQSTRPRRSRSSSSRSSSRARHAARAAAPPPRRRATAPSRRHAATALRHSRVETTRPRGVTYRTAHVLALRRRTPRAAAQPGCRWPHVRAGLVCPGGPCVPVQARYREARPRYERAIAVWRASLDKENERVGASGPHNGSAGERVYICV